MVRKFIDPNCAQTFQVVHRSQRDPLISQSALVLKPLAPSRNLLKKGKGLPPVFSSELKGHIDTGDYPSFDDAQYSDDSDDSEYSKEFEEFDENSDNDLEKKDPQETEGEDASNYGVFFKGQDYDYMKHLKVIGDDPTATYVPAKRPEKDSSLSLDLPADVLPPKTEEAIGMLGRDVSMPDFDPQMDPCIREILDALEDDAYVESDLEEDFFEALDSTELPSKFNHLVLQEQNEDDEEGDWMSEFKSFKKDFVQEEHQDDSSTVTPRQGHKQTKNATLNSMSSSSLFRNQKLTLLDDQFDKMLEEYSDEEIGELDADHPDVLGDSYTSLSSLHMEKLLDEFLQIDPANLPKTRSVSSRPMQSMEALRNELKDLAKTLVSKYDIVEEVGDEGILMPSIKVYDDETKWDIESMTSTCTNIYNHPVMIHHSKRTGEPQIRLRGRGKMPVVLSNDDDDESDSSQESVKINKGVSRKGESKEEKKARKAAVKLEKQERRVLKKDNKTLFKVEEMRQNRVEIQQSEFKRGSGI